MAHPLPIERVVGNLNQKLNSVSADVQRLVSNNPTLVRTLPPLANPQTVKDHAYSVLMNWTGLRTQNYYELSHHHMVLTEFLIEGYTGAALNCVTNRAREVICASLSSWSFVKKTTVAGIFRDLNYQIETPKPTDNNNNNQPRIQTYRQGSNGKPIQRKRKAVKYPKATQ